MATGSRTGRGEERRVKPREESKKKGSKRERRVKEETEAQEHVWTERRGKESALSASHQQRYEIFCHTTMKTRKISMTLRSSPRGESLSVHISKSTRIQKSLVRECMGLHITYIKAQEKTVTHRLLVLVIRQAVTMGPGKAAGQCLCVRYHASPSEAPVPRAGFRLQPPGEQRRRMKKPSCILHQQYTA